SGKTLSVPRGGRHLYLLVNDSYWADNSGGYSVRVGTQLSGVPSAKLTATAYATGPSASAQQPTELAPDKLFGFALPLDVKLSHAIESSSDLLHWDPATNVVIYFRDFDSGQFDKRFYRFLRK